MIEEIAQVMGVTGRMVYKALSYNSHTDIARRVRAMAIEMGGEVVGGEKLDTTFDIGVMVQTYGGRLRIVSDMRDGQIVVYIDGIVQECVSGLSIAEYVRLQQRYIRKVDVQ